MPFVLDKHLTINSYTVENIRSKDIGMKDTFLAKMLGIQ